MAKIDMFLAMVLANAKRVEACGLVLTVQQRNTRMDLVMADDSLQSMTAPPADVMIEIITALEGGQRDFRASVYSTLIEDVEVRRGTDGMQAYIKSWTIDRE